jgi:DNA-binding MarR family transcriptional regulator
LEGLFVQEYDLIDHIAKLARMVRRRPNIQVPRAGFNLLRILMDHEGIRTSELAEMLDIRPSSLTEGLNRLEAEGYVERRRNQEDTRIVHVHAKDRTRADFDRIHRESKALNAKLSACLTENELASFCGTCDKLCDYIARELGEECEHHHHHHHWGDQR